MSNYRSTIQLDFHDQRGPLFTSSVENIVAKSQEDGRQVKCYNLDWIYVKNSLSQKHNQLINFVDTDENYILFLGSLLSTWALSMSILQAEVSCNFHCLKAPPLPSMTVPPYSCISRNFPNVTFSRVTLSFPRSDISH